MRVRVKGFQIFRDRHGRWRCYHRKTRSPVDLHAAPLGSAEFFSECARIAALSRAVGSAKPGTLGLLIQQYRSHPAFTTDIAPRTRADYQRIFNYLKPIGETPLVRFDSPLVVRIRDRAAEMHGRRFGNYVKQVLSLVFAWGVERGYVARNPAEKIKSIRRQRGAPEANRPWTDAEREAVMTVVPAHMRLPMALMMYCGLDPQDALSLPRSAIKGDLIDSKRRKTGEAVWLPLPRPVREALAAAPRHSAMTVAANSRGRLWTGSGFRASWRSLKTELEAEGKVAPGLTLKGLRHTVATILAEMGYGAETIASMLGQKTEAMAQHYSRRADRSRKLAAVIAEFDVEVNRRRTAVVKPASKSVKPAGAC